MTSDLFGGLAPAAIETLEHAAALLESDAASIRETHARVGERIDWTGEAAAQRVHDDAVETAARLRGPADVVRGGESGWRPITDTPAVRTFMLGWSKQMKLPMFGCWSHAGFVPIPDVGPRIVPTHWLRVELP